MKRKPDFAQFLKVLRRAGTPSHLPYYEHSATVNFITDCTGLPFNAMSMDDPQYWKVYVDFWINLGFDCVPMEIPLNCPLPGGHGAVSEESEAKVVFATMVDYERYPWPDESSAIDFQYFEMAAAQLPDGAQIVGGVGAGPYEWASWMLGTLGMSYALADEPELVEHVFARIGKLHVSAVRQLASMEGIGAIRQGDDLGFKSSTFLRPDLLRTLVFPIYQRMAEESHRQDKPFILHSCGNLREIYDDLIACGIDAKHSFEDVILPVEDFQRQYGQRITPLGGLDVDVVCRSSEQDLRACTRRKIEQCFTDGYWALGTGNSLTDYLPVQQYLTVLDEARRVTGA